MCEMLFQKRNIKFPLIFLDIGPNFTFQKYQYQPLCLKKTKERSSYFTEKLSLQFFPENFSRRRLGDDVNKFNSSFKLLVLRQVGPDMCLNVKMKAMKVAKSVESQ